MTVLTFRFGLLPGPSGICNANFLVDRSSVGHCEEREQNPTKQQNPNQREGMETGHSGRKRIMQ